MKALLLCSVILLSGCVTKAPLQSDEVSRLLGRPDFTQAATAAPGWVEDALNTLNRVQLQRDLGR